MLDFLGLKKSIETIGSQARKLAQAIEMFAPDELQFLTVETAKPGVIERVYDDSVQEPLTASEQGRD